MLKKIQEFLRDGGTACLSDIALHLGADPEAVRPMLEMLEVRGRIRRIGAGPERKSCGGCTRCLPESLELWQLVEGGGGERHGR